MGSEVFLSPQVEEDLSDLWAYIALERKAPLSADRFVVKLHQVRGDCSKSCDRGAREDLGPGIRSCPMGRHLIFYRRVAEGIEVARVLSGHRDLAAILP